MVYHNFSNFALNLLPFASHWREAAFCEVNILVTTSEPQKLIFATTELLKSILEHLTPVMVQRNWVIVLLRSTSTAE